MQHRAPGQDIPLLGLDLGRPAVVREGLVCVAHGVVGLAPADPRQEVARIEVERFGVGLDGLVPGLQLAMAFE